MTKSMSNECCAKFRLAMVQRKIPFGRARMRMVLRIIPFGRARMRMVQAIKRHQACKRARMLKRIASDVTEPASPDAIRRHRVHAMVMGTNCPDE